MPASVTSRLFAKPHIRWGGLFLFWNAVGLVFVAHYYGTHLAEGIPFEWRTALWLLLGQYLWIFLTPVLVGLARRFPVTRANWRGPMLLHLGFAVVFCLFDVTFYTLLRWGVAATITLEAFDPNRYFQVILLRTLFFDVLFYLIIVAAAHVLNTERKFQARAVKMANLETQLAEAQLRSLRMQLNPHFLFNTLHTISAIMDENVKTARRLMTDLSDLLRTSLDQMREQIVPLHQELAFIMRYLGIEQERLQDRLRFSFEIEEPCRAALVPHLILQPLVENAIKHGIAPYARGGTIWVRAYAQDGRLVLEVEDDGPGLTGASGDGAPSTGIGLPTTRERLEYLFGREASFELREVPGGGLCVRMTLPLHTHVFETIEAP